MLDSALAQHSDTQVKNQKIATKFNWLLIASVLLSVLVTAGAITGYLLHRYNQDVIDKDRLHIKGLTGSVKGFIDNAFSLNYQLSINPIIVEGALAADPDWALRVQDYNRLYKTTTGFGDRSGLPLLVSMQKTYGFTELLFVQDARGDQVARSFGPLGHRGNRWWYKKFTAGGTYSPFISKSYYSMTGDKPVASAFHPIYNGSLFVGIMGTDINFDKLQNMVANYLDSKDLYAIVIDNEGVIIAHPDRQKLQEIYNLKKLVKNVLVTDRSGRTMQNKTGYHATQEEKLNWVPRISEIVTLALEGKSGMADDLMIDNKNTRVYYDPVPLPGHNGGANHYAVLLIRDKSSVAMTKFAICAFAAVFSAVIIAVLIITFRSQLRKSILLPLETLTQSMKDAGLDSQEAIHYEANDEFNGFVETYNTLRQNLARANKRLVEFNQALEKRVQERTQELKEVNDRLLEDIAQRKKVETALRESEHRYRQTLEIAPDSITISRASDGRFMEVNQAFCRLTGYSRKEALGSTALDLDIYVPSQKPADFLAVLKTKGEVNGFNVRLRKKDGEIRDMLLAARPLTYKDETCVMVVVTDISELKRAETSLRESEEKYRLLVENASDAIFITQDEKIQFKNPKAEKLDRLLSAGLSQLPVVMGLYSGNKEITLPTDADGFMLDAHGKAFSCRLAGKEGKHLWVQLNVVKINWEGSPADLYFIKDITHQKNLEDQIQQNARMEAIGTLAGGIAHDFNNLLMGIQGNVSLLIRKLKPDSDHYANIVNIQRIVKSGANLTRQLLGFARGGKYVVRPINLNRVVRETAQAFGRTRKEVTINENYAPTLWTVEADQGQIEQVLVNLYVNAWQAMPKGGNLFLTTENVILSEEEVRAYKVKPGKFAKLTIADNGTGMDEATLKRIFEPFFTTKTMGRGTGLGLASAFGIIKNHGGIIRISSQEGLGTTCQIYLPASRGPMATKEVAPEKPVVRGIESVLLVDDEEYILDVGKSMMEELGYDVVTALGGIKALELYREKWEKIDLVVLDIIMPDMSGAQVYDAMREINPNVKTLLSSGYSINVQATALLDKGCSGFIQKPYSIEQLSHEMRGVLDKA